MPLQGSGQITISDIYHELNGAFPGTNSNQSLASLSAAANNTDPCNPGNLPGSNSAPHAMSEFYAYDHNCTSGPSLTQCEVVGPFGNFDEACAVGPELCEQGQSIMVWTTGGTCCPQDGDLYYLDPNGTAPMEPGVYYPCQCELNLAFEYDGEQVALIIGCR